MIKRIAMTMALLSAPLAAQQTAAVQAGDQVRFRPGPRGVHQVVEARAGSLVVRREGWDPVVVAVDSATILRAAGREPRLRSALRGAGYGVLMGATGGAAVAAASFDEPGFPISSRSEAALFGGVTFGVLGGMIGGVAGVLSPRMRWAPLPARSGASAAAVAPTVRDGGLGASVTLRF